MSDSHDSRGQEPVNPGGPVDPSRWQAPDASDLDAYPPKGPECLRVRQRVRDYADGDMSATQAQQVDHHLEGCRDCSLAVARAEHETLRLRQALQPRRRLDGSSVLDAPEGFTDRLMARLLTEEGLPGADGSKALRLPRPDGDGEVPGDGPQPATRGRLLSLGSGGDGRYRTAALAVVAAAAAVLLTWILIPGADGARGWSVEVVESIGSAPRWSRAGAPLSAAPAAVEVGDALTMDPDSSVTIELGGELGPGGRPLDGRMTLNGPAAVGFGENGLVFWSGDLDLKQQLGSHIRVDLSGDWHAELDGGTARISMHEVLSPADLVSAGRTLRGSLEVPADGGSMARFIPPAESGDPMQVPPGFAVDFGTGIAPNVRRLLDPATLALVLSPDDVRQAGLSDATSVAMTGRVVDGTTGLGVPGALVTLQYDLVRDEVVTDPDGRFRSQLHGMLQRAPGDEVLVSVSPPAGREVLAPRLSGPISLGSELQVGTDGLKSVLGDLELYLSREVRGQMIGLVGQVDPADCTVRAAILDEALWRLTPLTADVVWDASGGFAVRGLPVSLQPRQQLVLLVDAVACAPMALPLGAGIGLDPTPMWVQVELQPQQTSGFALGAALAGASRDGLRAVQDVANLPGGLCLDVAPVKWSADGGVLVPSAALEASGFWLWNSADGSWWQPGEGGFTLASAPMVPIDSASDGLLFRAGERFGRLGAAEVTVNLQVLAPGGGAPAVDARVFAAGSDGPVTYLGRVENLLAGIGLEREFAANDADAAIVAVGVRGALDLHRSAVDGPLSGAVLELSPCGWIDGLRDGGGREFLFLRLLPVDGQGQPLASTGLLRCVRGADGWRVREVPAGRWLVQRWDGEDLGLADVAPGAGANLTR